MSTATWKLNAEKGVALLPPMILGVGPVPAGSGARGAASADAELPSRNTTVRAMALRMKTPLGT
jgi:hypothetical protein